MKYQAFTNDSLAMMHHGARGALAVDDELSKLGEEPRFGVRTTADWAEHAADLETEMLRRGMSFEAIDLSAPLQPDPDVKESVPTEPVSTDPAATDSAATESVSAEPDSTKSISSESAPTAPGLPFAPITEPVSDGPKTSKPSGSADNQADHDTRLRSRIAAVLKIRS